MKIRFSRPKKVLALFFLLCFPPAQADNNGLVMSIPYAINKEHIYKVIILEIDATPVKPAIKYHLAAGSHRITVSMMLDLEWIPDLGSDDRPNPQKDIRLDVKAGTSYQLGARLNVNATVESELDGSYWEPIIYREIEL